jgi:4-hydroxybenzoate polyprenyltransferase
MGGSSAVLAMLLFAILCSLNCMGIAVWERDLDRAQGKHSIATGYPSVGVSVRAFCILVAVAALLLATASASLFPIAISLSAGAALLTFLHFVSLGRDERTALADLVLLTPLAFLFAELLS